MSDSRFFRRDFWLSSSLLAFIFLSFLLPWDALSRSFLFFVSFPILLSFMFRRDLGNLNFDPMVLGSVLIVAVSVLINFLLDLPAEDSWQSFRWGLTTAGFLVCVYISAKLWKKHSIKYSKIFYLFVLFISIFNLILYLWEGKYPSRIQGFGFMDHPIVGPAGLICLWGVGMSLLISNQYIDNKNWFLSAISLISLLFVVFFSQSRGPLISILIYLIALIFVIVLHIGLKRRSFLRFAALFSGVIIIMASSGLPLVDSMIERGDSYRAEIFYAVVSEPPESIFLGSGSAAYFPDTPAGMFLKDEIGVSIEHPHNVILNVYYQSGLPILVIFLILIAGAINRIITNADSAYSMASGLSLLAVMLLLNTTDGSRIVAPPSSDWMFFWFPFAFLCGFYSEGKERDDAEWD